jgi:hypothetical protein
MAEEALAQSLKFIDGIGSEELEPGQSAAFLVGGW